jgi:hypothetical protein
MSFTREDDEHRQREEDSPSEQENLKLMKEMKREDWEGVGGASVVEGREEEASEISFEDEELREQWEREGDEMRAEDGLLSDGEGAKSLEME